MSNHSNENSVCRENKIEKLNYFEKQKCLINENITEKGGSEITSCFKVYVTCLKLIQIY